MCSVDQTNQNFSVINSIVMNERLSDHESMRVFCNFWSVLEYSGSI